MIECYYFSRSDNIDLSITLNFYRFIAVCNNDTNKVFGIVGALIKIDSSLVHILLQTRIKAWKFDTYCFGKFSLHHIFPIIAPSSHHLTHVF